MNFRTTITAKPTAIRKIAAVVMPVRGAWIHQVLLGLPSALIGLDLLLQGQTSGVIAAIGLLLAWIGGTLVWGLAALMHQRTVYERIILLGWKPCRRMLVL
jgi:hypothetical protein